MSKTKTAKKGPKGPFLPTGAKSIENKVLAAAAAGAMVYGTRPDDGTSLPVTRYDFLSKSPINKAAEEAAAFIRANPAAPVHAIPLQLSIRKHRPEGAPSRRELAAWAVFKAALVELDAVDAEEAAAKAAEAERARPKPNLRPHAERAMKPEPGPMTPSAMRPTR